MIKKIYIIIIIAILTISALRAQNDYHLSQYFQNASAFNPAFTGVDNFIDVRSGFRQQWTGLENGAQTYYLTVNALIKKSRYDKMQSNALRISDPSMFDEEETEDFNRWAATKHGIGGYFINDNFGPFNRLYGYVTYGFHFPVTRRVKIALGAAGGINSNTVDTEEVVVRDPDIDDTYQSFLAQGVSSNHFNFNVGGLIYSDRFFLGYGVHKLMQNEIFINDELSSEKENLTSVFNAGYSIIMGPDYLLLPSVMLQMSKTIPTTADFNLKFRYRKSFWSGFTYRNSESVILMAGFYLDQKYSFGYSYDFAVNGVNEYLRGSHEIVLGLHLNNNKNEVPFAW